ncbi:MAG TPA: CDP-diacylglycerol--glycerol-3-phosphate 3-phosphatidyltransferase [Candidatus Sumerlaeota bacterium]|nr:MAG: CDP-diacylglycerol--glycerol-3-phosphate 3-phosphatidyltransferase [candidate division BRC1 bacterium ADurb.BinA292]HOE98034.1 CDP-diacylglycerol--glycerol-3-phosphate 3-phosphatidyltransferase [Candidatus Sumerlaeota bacterium]HOR28338.1 CDP-diacylglycerol--glycerol-3-phosphate 3-phosphatidyltransferase [Candidatus Sumerlaeota bacterium]HPK04134.1 CDP-diacylglycerol--glycerol-3-phosphate 3-phosphatidyltransferase [Candidatus Sumerlaeota bacterium]
MNLSNKLTVLRILIVPVFLLALTPGRFLLPAAADLWLHPLALVLFIIAAITDYYDGMLARRHGWVTNFGKLMDPLADKVLVMAAFVGMVELRLFAAWMVAFILAREFLITGLRLLATAEGRVLAADRWGKNKTITQMTAIIAGLVFLIWRDIVEQFALPEAARASVGYLHGGLQALMLATVVLTIASGARYFIANRDVIAER